MEARRERVRLNVALMKKEEEERKLKEGSTQKGKAAGPDLSSFIRQFPGFSEGVKVEEQTDGEGVRNGNKSEKNTSRPIPESSEPTGSGQTYKPGTWQPPT
uniref:NADH dehydrogenase [ubiquinone] 1 alpha subcomplex subunit 12 n=2 Tax=Cannabis sativa TaxID=3483 RepID=A0A803QBQ6_CANSA